MIEAVPWHWTVTTITLTYMVHSTVFLLGGWLLLRVRPSPSPLLHERVWKFAALAGFLTMTLQVVGNLGPRVDFGLARVGEDSAPVDSIRSGLTSHVGSKIPVQANSFDIASAEPSTLDERWKTTTSFSHRSALGTQRTFVADDGIQTNSDAESLGAGIATSDASRGAIEPRRRSASGQNVRAHVANLICLLVACAVITWVVVSGIRVGIQSLRFSRVQREYELISEGPISQRTGPAAASQSCETPGPAGAIQVRRHTLGVRMASMDLGSAQRG